MSVTKKAVRDRIQSAANAAQQLKEDVAWIVSVRGWDVLGYDNLSAMWTAECGFECPTVVQVVGVDTLRAEGLRGQGRTRKDGVARPGHTYADIARMIGLTLDLRPNGKLGSNSVMSIIAQLMTGIPVDQITKSHRVTARPKPRRLGAAPDDLVSVSVGLPRRDADAVEEIARDANVPNSEIYRQAVAEYLARIRATRKKAA